MGSLISKPSIPKTQTVVVRQVAPAPTQTVTTPATPTAPAAPDPQVIKQEREKNLLERDRSRFGTIETSFRGLLGLMDGGAPKKTLLGE